MTTTKTQTLSQFCEVSNLNPKLIRAVVRQIGGWKSFQESAPDISGHGIDGGFHGFIYTKETEAFARQNLELIREMAKEQASDMGMSTVSMILGFGCFKHGAPTEDEVGSALYAGKEIGDGPSVLNALAWYAGEEVARSFCDLMESN